MCLDIFGRLGCRSIPVVLNSRIWKGDQPDQVIWLAPGNILAFEFSMRCKYHTGTSMKDRIGILKPIPGIILLISPELNDYTPKLLYQLIKNLCSLFLLLCLHARTHYHPSN